MSSITAGNSVSQSELSRPTTARSGTEVFGHKHLFARPVEPPADRRDPGKRNPPRYRDMQVMLNEKPFEQC